MAEEKDKVLAFYGLFEQPFLAISNPRYLYLTPQHREAVAQCRYTIEKKNGLAVIHGDVGTGKTTVARHVYNLYRDNAEYTIAMITNPTLKTDTAFLRAVLDEFRVPTKRSHAGSLKAFQKYAVSQYKAGKSIVILVDEAQLMTRGQLEVVRAFMNFEGNNQKLVQVILFGQNELATMLDKSRAIKSRVSAFGSLSSLTDSTINDMIRFRWTVAGGDEPHPFSVEAIQKIARYSQGLPREIIKLCNASLLRAYSNKSNNVHDTMIDAAAKQLRLTEVQ